MDSPFNTSFLGAGWGFPPRFDLRHGSNPGLATRVVSEDEDIRESLYILFSTSPGERIMNPAFGCNLRPKVFEVISQSLVTEIRDLVERAILFFEPRISLNRVDVLIRDALGGILDILVDYTIRSTNTRSNMVYPFYLLEATNAPR